MSQNFFPNFLFSTYSELNEHVGGGAFVCMGRSGQ